MSYKRAIVYINQQEIASLLKLPEGLHVLGVSSDFVRMSIAVMIEGESLPLSPEGVVIPEYMETDGSRWNPRFKQWIDGYREGMEQGRRDAIDERGDG